MKHIKPLVFFFTIATLVLLACNSGDKKDIQSFLEIKKDTLEFDNTKDTMLIGPKGTGLFFEKESFVLPDGSTPKGRVTVAVKECYSFADMVRENLSTTSGSKILETGGMINVTAFADDKELVLRDGKKYTIFLPKDTTASGEGQPKMNLFYGQRTDNGSIDWVIDTAKILKTSAHLTGFTIGSTADGDTSSKGWWYRSVDTDKMFSYFYKNFDIKKVKNADALIGKEFEINYVLDQKGKIRITQVEEVRWDTAGYKLPPSVEADPYFGQFVQSVTGLKPYRNDDFLDKVYPFDIEGSFNITILDYPNAYEGKEYYNQAFKQKYSAFQSSNIQSMSGRELDVYVLSASRLGWINCDYFWQTSDPKINYYVKADPSQKPMVKLIFKQAKSLMTGTLEGDKYVFGNIPINQEVKIVSITYNGDQPLMAIAKTRTEDKMFTGLEYKPFTIAELDKQLMRIKPLALLTPVPEYKCPSISRRNNISTACKQNKQDR